MLAAFKKSKAEMERGAYAISLGLLGEEDAVPALLAVLDRAGQPKLKGYAAVGLGLLNVPRAIPTLRATVMERGAPELRKSAALALGLLRDGGAVPVLREAMQDAVSSKTVLGAVTVALGRIGGEEALAPIAADLSGAGKRSSQVTRAFAAVALGFLGDKDLRPVLSYIHAHSNFLSQTESFGELLSIL